MPAERSTLPPASDANGIAFTYVILKEHDGEPDVPCATARDVGMAESIASAVHEGRVVKVPYYDGAPRSQ